MTKQGCRFFHNLDTRTSPPKPKPVKWQPIRGLWLQRCPRTVRRGFYGAA